MFSIFVPFLRCVRLEVILQFLLVESGQRRRRRKSDECLAMETQKPLFLVVTVTVATGGFRGDDDGDEVAHDEHDGAHCALLQKVKTCEWCALAGVVLVCWRSRYCYCCC